MKTLNAHLRLSPHLNGSTRERCPDVVFIERGDVVATIRTDAEHPTLPLDDGTVTELIIHDDALSRTIDEEAWLREFSRVIAVDGRLRFTVPAAGALAWLDTMNAYRYVVDITGRGDAPDAANPTGWNRHYSRDHLVHLLNDAGFGVPGIVGQNHALKEIRLLTGLMWANWVNGDRSAELRLFPRFGERVPAKRSFVPATTWSVSARKIETNVRP